jgi:octopine/nopaline transport system ATP-binding protein
MTPGTGPAVALEVAALTKRFGAIDVLRGVSLQAGGGEVVTVLGASGSGKSTLLRCINLLETPDSGTVTVAGETIAMKESRGGGRRPVDRRQVDRIRSRLGMVFQNFNLWSHLTILDNLIEAPVHVQRRPRREIAIEAEALLARLGIADKRDCYPFELSGGQLQRAAIARALAMRPAVMLFDEPTSALDPERTGDLLRLLQSLAAEGRTMLLATHEVAFARELSSRIVFLNRGVVEAEGTPERMFGAGAPERFRRFVAGTDRTS